MMHGIGRDVFLPVLIEKTWYDGTKAIVTLLSSPKKKTEKASVDWDSVSCCLLQISAIAFSTKKRA